MYSETSIMRTLKIMLKNHNEFVFSWIRLLCWPLEEENDFWHILAAAVSTHWHPASIRTYSPAIPTFTHLIPLSLQFFFLKIPPLVMYTHGSKYHFIQCWTYYCIYGFGTVDSVTTDFFQLFIIFHALVIERKNLKRGKKPSIFSTKSSEDLVILCIRWHLHTVSNSQIYGYIW